MQHNTTDVQDMIKVGEPDFADIVLYSSTYTVCIYIQVFNQDT